MGTNPRGPCSILRFCPWLGFGVFGDPRYATGNGGDFDGDERSHESQAKCSAMRIPPLVLLFVCIGCTPNSDKSTSHSPADNDPAMSLDAAAARLAELSGAPVRDYSTHDFGRSRDTNAKSVVVPHDQSAELIAQFREQLGPNLICFIGTTRWLGDEKHDGDEIVVAKGTTQFDILRVSRADAINYEMETEDLIKKLKDYDNQFGIDVFHAETDTVEFSFVKMPEDLSAFCKDLYQFCPDIVDQGTGTVERLEQEINERKQVFLWWD